MMVLAVEWIMSAKKDLCGLIRKAPGDEIRYRYQPR